MIPVDFKGAALARSPGGLMNTAAIIKCRADIVQAVVDVETSGSGFLSDRRPRILSERHYFHRRTDGRFDAAYPAISSASPGGYAGGAAEYARLEQMMQLDRVAAFESTSWGLPQIMGANYRLAGYADAESMVAAFCSSEDEQLLAMARFIVAAHLDDELRREDVAGFSEGYNGKNYVVNHYDKRIIADLARIRIMAGASQAQAWPAARQLMAKVQASLNLHGFGPLDPDGWAGPKTSAALSKFQAQQGLPKTAQADGSTVAALLGAQSVRG